MPNPWTVVWYNKTVKFSLVKSQINLEELFKEEKFEQ
jgi:hypothetical protein